MRWDSRILFTGPIGAGKTAAIHTLSDPLPVDSPGVGNASSDPYLHYGQLNLGESGLVHLVGHHETSLLTPSDQTRVLGVVMLLSNARPQPLQDCRHYLNACAGLMAQGSRLVIGISHMDMNPRPSLDSYYTLLEELNIPAPVMEVDCRQPQDVKTLIKALLYSLEPTIGLVL